MACAAPASNSSNSQNERMTLYRPTDAADTMNMAAMLIAAYCQRTNMAPDTLQSYLQVGQHDFRSAGPQDEDSAHLTGLLGKALSYEMLRTPRLRTLHGHVQQQAEQAQTPEDDPQKLFTEACPHALRARLSEDIDTLDNYLPPRIAATARKVTEVLEEPQPAPVTAGSRPSHRTECVPRPAAMNVSPAAAAACAISRCLLLGGRRDDRAERLACGGVVGRRLVPRTSRWPTYPSAIIHGRDLATSAIDMLHDSRDAPNFLCGNRV